MPVIEFRKNNYFYTIFSNGERAMPDSEGTTAELVEKLSGVGVSNIITTEDTELHRGGKIVITGPGTKALCGGFHGERYLLDLEDRNYAKELIAIATAKDLFNSPDERFLYTGPEYIRKTDAEISLKK